MHRYIRFLWNRLRQKPNLMTEPVATFLAIEVLCTYFGITGQHKYLSLELWLTTGAILISSATIAVLSYLARNYDDAAQWMLCGGLGGVLLLALLPFVYPMLRAIS